jgi:hypothetical protein
MHKQPEFYSLEFHGDVDFWGQTGDATRRTFLMPLSTPAEFLAFGVLGPSNEVLFVARGRVRDHLGDFIVRMVQAGASVELYARAPLPGHILNDYIKDNPHEQKETDNPPPLPNWEQGTVVLRSGYEMTLQDSTPSLWSTEGAVRVVLLTPALNFTDRLVAFGLVQLQPDSQRAYDWGVNFVAVLHVSERENFESRMKQENASVEATPYQGLCRLLQSYMTTYSGSAQLAAA